MKLTKQTIDSLKPAAAEFWQMDGELPGFGVKVYPSGQKTFFVRYRDRAGASRKIKLGRLGAITPDQARKLAKERLGAIAGGADPAGALAAHRAGDTLGDVAARFLKTHAARVKASTLGEYERALSIYTPESLRARKIADIKRPDMVELHNGLAHIPTQANRTIAALSKLFNFAKNAGLRDGLENPCVGLERYKERARERYLTADELTRLAGVLNEYPNPYAAAALKLLILSGCRLAEIRTLKWDYITDGYITFPDSKTGKRSIPLTDEITAVLSSLPAANNQNPYVIVGDKPGTHYRNLQRAWEHIRIKADLAGVRIHDLRHTYASHALDSGLDLPTIGKLLGHSKIQTTQRYAHLMDGKLRAGAAATGAALGALIAPSTENLRMQALPSPKRDAQVLRWQELGKHVRIVPTK